MADVSITPANVLKGSDALDEDGLAGATIEAGQVVYKDSDSKFQLTDTDSGTAAAKVAYGIALNGAADGQPLKVQRGGRITIGGTLVPGTAYYASETPGGIQPGTDLATEDVAFLGHAVDAAVLDLRIYNTGVTVA